MRLKLSRVRFLIAAAVALFSVTPGRAEIVTMTFGGPLDLSNSTAVDGISPSNGLAVSGSLSFDPSTFTSISSGRYEGPATFTARLDSKTYSATSVFSFTMSNTSGLPFYFEAQAQSNTGVFMELNSSSTKPLFGNPNVPGSFLSQQIFGEFFLDPVSPDTSKSTILLFDPLTINVSAVPEPSTWAMMIFGFFAIGFMAYRKRAALSFA